MYDDGVLARSGEAFRELGEKIGDFFSNLKYSISNFWEEHEITEKIKEFWEKMGEWLQNGWEMIKKGFQSIGEGFVWLGHKIAEIGGKALEGIKTAAIFISDKIKTFASFIGEKFSSAIDWFKENLPKLGDKIKTGFSIAIENTKKFISGVAEKCREFFSTVGTKMKEFGSNFVTAMRNLKDKMGEKWSEISPKIKEFFSNAKVKIIAGVTAVVAGVKLASNKFKNYFAGLKEKMSQKLTAIREARRERKEDKHKNRELKKADKEAKREEKQAERAKRKAEKEGRKRQKDEIQGLNPELNDNDNDEFVGIEPSPKNKSNDKDDIEDGEYGIVESKPKDMSPYSGLHEIEEDDDYDIVESRPGERIFDDDDDDFNTIELDDDDLSPKQVEDYWEIIKTQMERTKNFEALSKSFYVNKFMDTMDKIIGKTSSFIATYENDMFDNFEECLAIIPNYYPALKEDVLIVFDMLDKLSSDLKTDNVFSFEDKKNIQKFLDDYGVDYFGYGFGLDEFAKQKLEQKSNETSTLNAISPAENVRVQNRILKDLDAFDNPQDTAIDKNAILYVEEPEKEDELLEIGIYKVKTELDSVDFVTLDGVFYGNEFSNDSVQIFNDKNFYIILINNIYVNDKQLYIDDRVSAPILKEVNATPHGEVVYHQDASNDSSIRVFPEKTEFMPVKEDKKLDPAIEYVMANFQNAISSRESMRL